VLAGLARADLFTVVLEQFPTDTTDYADIVLPVTTALEHFDLVPAWGHLYLTLSEPALAPLGECKPNTEIFRLLAARMGFDEPAFRDSDEEMAVQALKTKSGFLAGVTLERLRAEGYVRVNVAADYAPFAEGGFYTPSRKCEFYAEAEARRGRDPLPAYVPPHESAERDPERARRYPLQLLSPKAHHFLNSTFSAQPSLARASGRPEIEIHAQDAAARGIGGGDLVRVFNDRGEFAVHARLSERVRPGLVVVPSVWWNKQSRNGHNANATTSEALTDLGGGATFFDNRVEVALWE
jgi:anaerobic selenocysteine-containing dehydrogenase